MNVLVDTSVWSLALRRKTESLNAAEKYLVVELSELIREGRTRLIGLVRQELLSGIKTTEHYEKLRLHLRSFPDEPIDTSDHEEAAKAGNAIISTEIADIFRNNSLKNGLLPIVVDCANGQWLLEHPGAEVMIDLPNATLELPTGTAISFPIESFARYCLANGVDELGFLLAQEPQISAFEQRKAS